jgi:capsular polysaccharide biosynthesis protein
MQSSSLWSTDMTEHKPKTSVGIREIVRMTDHKPKISVGIREIVRWWPLLTVVTLIAVGAAIWSGSGQAPSYTATTRLVVVPLAQFDELFLGTSLVRDAGDPTRTGATVAAQLNSSRAASVTADYMGSGWTPESVAAAVKVSNIEGTNLLQIVARSADADTAAKLSETFAEATLADRWKTISAQLGARIDVITNSTVVIPENGETQATFRMSNEVAARLETLKMVRDTGSDPTLRVDSTSPAVPSKQLPIWLIIGLATAGGLFVGLLAAIGMARLRRRMNQPTEEPALHIPTQPYSTNGWPTTASTMSEKSNGC